MSRFGDISLLFMLLQACHYNLTISRIYHSLFYTNFQTKLPPCLFPSSPPISLLLILQDDTTSAMATDNLSSGTQGSSRQCRAGAWPQHERGPSPSIPSLKVVPQTTTGPYFLFPCRHYGRRQDGRHRHGHEALELDRQHWSERSGCSAQALAQR